MTHPRIIRPGSLRPTPAYALSAMAGTWAMSAQGRVGLQSLIGSAASGDVSSFLATADMKRVDARAEHYAKSALFSGDEWYFDPTMDAHVRPSGVGVLPIRGALMTRAWWCWTGYDVLGLAGQEMLETRGLRAIVMPVDSPGGACAGLSGLAAKIRAWRSVVRVYGVIDLDACSAAACLAAQATSVFVGRDTTYGHVGTWSDWWDMTEYLRAQGIRHGYMSRGENKTFFAGDDTEIAPAEQDAKRELVMAPIVQGYYDLLLDDVAAGRGARMPREAARATEAMIYFGAGAIAAGLADAVGTFEDVIEALEDAEEAPALEVA